MSPINHLAIHENQMKRSRRKCNTEQVVGKFMLSRCYRFSPFFDKLIRSYSTQVSLKSKLELYYKMSTNPKLALQSPAEAIYFGKEAVNRVSFLREDSEFITNALFHPSTRFIFYENGNPLVNKDVEEDIL